MADYQSPRAETSSISSMKRKKKRKLPDLEKNHDEKASKSSRIDHSNESVNESIEENKSTSMKLLEDAIPWRNLQLILSLQNKNLDIEKKVELAYKFVKLSFNQVEDDTTQISEVVSFERVIISLSNWVQSTLISSEKKIRVEGVTGQFGAFGSCLDYRSWEIFKFCLEEGTKRNVSMSFPKDILKVIHCIATNTEIKELNDDELMLYNTMLDCISSIFTSHGGVSNENLDLWILLIGTVLELVLKTITDKINDSRLRIIVMNLTCLVLDPFTKFLRLHPNRKNSFHDFVDRLLEPLLSLLHMLQDSAISSNNTSISKLLKLVKDVLFQGLFHPSHIDGFSSLQSLVKYKNSNDEKQKESKTVIKSYHRHLFDKLAKLTVEKKSFALFGEGEFFRLYIDCIKKQENVSAEIRKSLFDFFVQIMEPFIGQVDAYIQYKTDIGYLLQDIHCTLKLINLILISLMQEKVYLKVDDISEGACANFLKLICDKITLISAKIVTSAINLNIETCNDLLASVAKEVVLCVRYLLEIDYEVFGNDLESLWLLMFSYGTIGHNLQNQSSIISEIVNLGCFMVNLYSELRQVGTSVFALCKALRRLESSTKSLRLILCSPDLRLSVHNAIKSIPEGQVSLCIQELVTDLTESLEWIHDDDSKDSCVNLKSEVFGIGLSEVYALILDSLLLTCGNSNLVGVSLNDLITVIRPIMSVLISEKTDGVYEFLSTVSGRKSTKDKIFPANWFFIFFFRLYMSSRSVYRQAISLANPTTSKRMSEIMWDPFTSSSGNDWLEKTEKDEGYFSWIFQPSISLLLIIETISDIYLIEKVDKFSTFSYVLNCMAIQRLVDINRLINSFEFVIKRNELNENDKKNKRLRKRVLKLSEEATGLTNYITEHFSLLKSNCLLSEDGWNISVADIDKKSFCCAFWCILCHNIDIWSMHASKKKLKMFLLLALENSIPYARNDFEENNNNNVIVGKLKTVTRQDVSLELLSNTMFYEQKFVRKHMASTFCRFLEELVSPLFNNGFDIKLQDQPNWPDVLTTIEIPSDFSISSEQEVDLSVKMIYTVCENSLNFLSWMPKRCKSSKSFSLYATCILNLERLIVGTLLGSSLHDHNRLLQLLLYCRKTVKNLMVTFCEENINSNQNSLSAIHFEGNFPALWLLKSLLSVQNAFSKDENTPTNDLMFSLTDYTLYVFSTLIKSTFVHASHFLISSRKTYIQKSVSINDKEDTDQSESMKACSFMIHVAETLTDHLQIIGQTTSKGQLQKISSVIACFQGFLWGLSSTLSYMDTQNTNLKAIFMRRNFEPVDKLKLCIDTYTNFVSKFLCELVLLQDDKLVITVEKTFNLENLDTESVGINTEFLCSLLSGENIEAAFFIRQLFIAYSAILKLNLQIKTLLSLNMVNIYLKASETLLLEFSNNTKTPTKFTFVFLDGIGKFLEELGNHLSVTNPNFPSEIYTKLVDLHLKAIGKCISLQQKGATLESHETESSRKSMNSSFAKSECVFSSLDELKRRLRTSFKNFVRKASESCVLLAVQSIKKALIGLQERCLVNYEINMGKVSSVVAAGVDCLDLLLEAITGRKGLSMVKTDILSSVSCLFNIITHLQGPQIFYKTPISNTHNYTNPDSGSVILMCIEVLTKVSGKHALYQMDACYVAQALSIPATVFQNIIRINNIQDNNESILLFDGEYSLELYAACCRMLYTFLRHHKRESVEHIALLQASVSVLLHCLELVNKSSFAWGLQEGINCASFLRRIYEEIRQQKDVIGPDCRLFLSSYIVVYSGIAREIDEALRGGVYALIDACSPDDLQYLHTVLGEGPCRNTLANLQHDYKLNFQYQGKV